MAARFLTELETRHLGPQRKALTADLIYEDARGRVFIVPRGFVCDGASVPRFLWALYPAFGEAYEPAAWLHDWLYAQAEDILIVAADGEFRPINRGEADALFREASLVLGFRGTGAAVMHSGVRLGGWLPWRRYRAKVTAEAPGAA